MELVNREVKLICWSGYHTDENIPVEIEVEYDEELDEYIVEVKRGTKSAFKTFTPKHEMNGVMHISDVEKSVKLASVILKKLKREATRKKK